MASRFEVSPEMSEANFSGLIYIGETYKFKDNKVNKTWIIHPVLAELKELPDIRLDWEHTEYKWIKPKELKKFDIVTNLEKSYEKAIL